MNKQEMGGSLARASTFLGEVHQVKFYSLLQQLVNTQETLLREKRGQEAIYALHDIIMQLSHQKDLKVTFSNGFHVNTAVTSQD